MTHDDSNTSDSGIDDRTTSDNEHGDYTDPEESGLRSGKGNGFFRRLLLGKWCSDDTDTG